MSKSRAEAFRYVYINAFGMQMNEFEVRLSCAFYEDVAAPEESTVEVVGLVMHPRTAKLLAHSLSKALSEWEQNNFPIPIPAEKLSEIEAQIQINKGSEKG